MSYKCSYCTQTNGSHLGYTVDGFEVCSNCGTKAIKNGKEVFVHFPDWENLSDITTHRR